MLTPEQINNEILCIRTIHDLHAKNGFKLDLHSFARAIESLANQEKDKEIEKYNLENSVLHNLCEDRFNEIA